jgi:hypothetical protein
MGFGEKAHREKTVDCLINETLKNESWRDNRKTRG